MFHYIPPYRRQYDLAKLLRQATLNQSLFPKLFPHLSIWVNLLTEGCVSLQLLINTQVTVHIFLAITISPPFAITYCKHPNLHKKLCTCSMRV